MAALGLCKDSDVGLVQVQSMQQQLPVINVPLQGVTHKRQSEFLLALFHLAATKTAK